jgi:hypothetical protein|nr:MAG TPA: hypothetical protein [Caudoviricetes sp.]
MEVYLLDGSYQPVGVIDNYKSLIWTSRYNSPGDFELYIPASKKLLELLDTAIYVQRDDVPTDLMLIEKIQITKDKENGTYIIASGRNLLSYLSRRIVTEYAEFTNEKASDIIISLIKTNFLPIPVLEDSTANPRYCKGFDIDKRLSNTGETMTAQYKGENVLDKIMEICQANKFGMKIRFDREAYDNNRSYILFSLYKREKVDYTFSEGNENIQNITCTTDYTNWKNCAVVFGEGEGRTQWVREAFRLQKLKPLYTGFYRREICVDASNTSAPNTTNGQDIYEKCLINKGSEELHKSEIMNIKTFQGTIIAKKEDFRNEYDVGNIVEVEDIDSGLWGEVTITEATECWDDSGYTITLTLDDQKIYNSATIL